MDRIKIEVTGNIAKVIERPKRITSGTVGLTAEFSFDSQWDGLAKTAIFRACNEKRIIECIENEAVVPWEVLKEPNLWLTVGVYGAKSDGLVVIPTVWANVCVIKEGATPDGDPSIDPTLPVWKQLSAEIEDLREEVENGGGGGGSGKPGKDGYSPTAIVAQTNNGAVISITDVNGTTTATVNHGKDADLSLVTKAQQTADDAQSDVALHQSKKNNPHNVTAAQVGARPDDWTPTAEDVGARPADWTPTAEDVGARPTTWTPTADEVGARPNTWLPTILDIGAQAQHRSATVTLAAANWVNNKQTVAVDFATSSNTIFPSPDPAHYELYVENGVIATAQANGSVTFLCERVPDADIVVNLAIFAEGIGGAGKVTAIDFTNFLNGSFTEVVDGEPYTHSVNYDEATGVMQIDDITITFPVEEGS